ncbi:metal-dependent hydrolase [Natronomonas sp. F2-12]|uniref:Metal-dependent hydrolase n=1 Tax=Natronomonas aquatica TaxID=2841590 RepID=A0A9R1CSW8_9EURY|nr:metal-dependent hydrolase [Natronomonas aquatica]MCQ4334748.1 metal-dependent hydrolase [Natronomonas aquatica]
MLHVHSAPGGHAAVGYLLYTALCRFRTESIPDGAAVLALAVGTQFADLLDKPLAWYLGVLPSGRSLGHSVFATALLLVIVHRVATHYRRRELSIAFAVGHLLHLAGDAVYPLLDGDLGELQFLLWPAVSQSGGKTGYTILETLIELSQTTGGLIELALFLVATGLWLSHRAPGLRLCLGVVRSLGRGR